MGRKLNKELSSEKLTNISKVLNQSVDVLLKRRSERKENLEQELKIKQMEIDLANFRCQEAMNDCELKV